MRYAFQILIALALTGCVDDAPAPATDGGPPADLGPRCAEATACDDGDPCTRDRCVEGRCVVDRAAAPPLEVEGVVPADGLSGLALTPDTLLLSRVRPARSAVEVWDLRGLPAATQQLDRAAEADEGDFVGVMPLGDGLLVYETPTRLRLLGPDGASLGLYAASDPPQASRALDDHRALVAVFSKGLEVVDFSEPAEPNRAVRVDTPGRALGVASAGRYWLVADGLAGLGLVDSRADPPRRLDAITLPTQGRVLAVDAADTLAITAESGAGLGVFELEGLTRVALLPLGGAVHDVALAAPGLAAAATDRGLVLVDLLRPSAPRPWGPPAGEPAQRVVALDGRLAVGSADSVALYRLNCAVPEPDLGVDAGADGGLDAGP